MVDSLAVTDVVEGCFIPFVAVFGILGNVASIISLKKLKGSFPRPTTNFSINDALQFELKLFCPKLDEVAKDENVESGVEDTDEESKD